METTFNTSEQQQPKTIRFKRNYYCDKNCFNYRKYIHKKEGQWKEYMATSGMEFNPITKKPKKQSLQMNIDQENKRILVEKIR